MPGIALELAGDSLAAYPHFDFLRSYSTDDTVEVAVDPSASPELVGETCDVYVVESRTAAEWCADAALLDARGAPDTRSFLAGSTTRGVGVASPTSMHGLNEAMYFAHYHAVFSFHLIT